MVSTPLERINRLIPYLPAKDILIANKLFESRDFDSLSELVTSTIIRIKRNLKLNIPKKEYQGIDLDILEKLRLELEYYIKLIEYEE